MVLNVSTVRIGRVMVAFGNTSPLCASKRSRTRTRRVIIEFSAGKLIVQRLKNSHSYAVLVAKNIGRLELASLVVNHAKRDLRFYFVSASLCFGDGEHVL